MSDIIKEVRVREFRYNDRDVKVTIEKSGLLNNKRKVSGIPWGKKEETWSTWEPIEFTIKDLTEENNFGEYSRFYAEYIKERDQPKNTSGNKNNFYQRNNLEFSSEWNTDLDIIKLYILINAEKYMNYTSGTFYEWNLIEDPIVGEKGGQAPYYRYFGIDSYYLNNGVEIKINWDGSLGEKWSDDKGNELDNTNTKFYFEKEVLHKNDIIKSVYSIDLPDGITDSYTGSKSIYYRYGMIYTNREGKYISSFSPTKNDVNVSKASLGDKYKYEYGGDKYDIYIIDEIIKKWKENVPGYENLDIVKSINGTPVISLSDAVDYKRIEYKSPFSTEIGLSASGASASGASASGASASGPISTSFKLTFEGIQDGFQITAKTDLPSFSIYVGDPKKDWPVVGAGDLPQDGEDFENVEGAPQEGIDEEYTEESFMGAEESELQFNDTIIVSPTDEKEDSGSYLDKGGAGSEQIGPIEPGLPANEAQKESAKKSRVATGCMSSGGGACARYTWNLAKNYHRFLKGLTGLPQREAAGGNAKQAAYYNRLVEELKYKKIENKSSVTKDDLIKSIKDTKWGIGDVICYWSNGSGGESHQIYGHTQMYVGAISAGGWASDQVDNFSCSMVYKSKTDNNWGYVAFRSPDTPSNS